MTQLPKRPPSFTLRSRLPGDGLGEKQDEDFDGECILDGVCEARKQCETCSKPVQRKCRKIQHNTLNQPPRCPNYLRNLEKWIQHPQNRGGSHEKPQIILGGGPKLKNDGCAVVPPPPPLSNAHIYVI